MSRTMLYKRREGPANPAAWNLPLDTKAVADSEIAAHQADGWKTAADLNAPEAPKPPPRAVLAGKPTRT